MKLGTLERISLRKAVRSHPDILNHVAKPGDVNSLPKDRLVELAGVLGLDVDAAVRADATDPLMNSWEEVEARELRENGERHPAFTGELHFELEMQLFGHRVVRQARVVYTHTPEWEYYDLVQKQLMPGWGSSSYHFEVLVVPTGGQVIVGRRVLRNRRKVKPCWTTIDLVVDGLLPDAVDDDVFDRIDEDARRQDAQRREAAGMNAPTQ